MTGTTDDEMYGIVSLESRVWLDSNLNKEGRPSRSASALPSQVERRYGAISAAMRNECLSSIYTSSRVCDRVFVLGHV